MATRTDEYEHVMDVQTWKDARTRATDVTEEMRAALSALGLPESAWSGMRPTVTYAGRPYVHLGMLPADVVEQMAQAMGGHGDFRPRGGGGRSSPGRR
ncbi:hypothetical protein ACFV0R_24010 [Streptomyces sp. NPDC059578]|uniref:hypothetical protein n=1 Tax=Streptomyces sp. NPDC059578 TaxID=3346874 RepID=UPI0036CC6C5B